MKRTGYLAILAAAATTMVGLPAHAQFSDGYKFLEAVREKDGVKVEQALSEPGSTVIHTRDIGNGQGALHIVVARRDLTWLQFLVAKGASVNVRDDNGVTPLQLATSLGWHEGVEFLVERKADADEPNDTGETPLISAIHRGDVALARILLKGGANPDRADNSGRTARDYAQLSSKRTQLVAVIDENATTGAKNKGKAVYGPTF